jgi:subtilisin family serine protease
MAGPSKSKLDPFRPVVEGKDGGYQLIVTYEDDHPTSKDSSALAQSRLSLPGAADAALVDMLDLINGEVLEVAKTELSDVLDRLNDHPSVKYAEPDYVISLSTLKADSDALPASSAGSDGSAAPAALTNDPDLDQLWGLSRISAVDAWDVTVGSSDVIIGVVDTGVDYTHPDLAVKHVGQRR